jgi:uncharacterized protein YktB (UPF0637 family)
MKQQCMQQQPCKKRYKHAVHYQIQMQMNHVCVYVAINNIYVVIIY